MMSENPFVIEESLTGKRVLLTGGSTGIGRATLAVLARAGARIVTCARHMDELREALEHSKLDPTLGVEADISRPDDIARIFAAVDERLGGLDVLIGNAAIGARPLTEAADQEWRYAVETNLLGTIACTRGALSRMEAAGGGQVVLVSSISAEILSAGESVYAATKGGLNAFGLALRKEVSDRNIRVSLIEPGSVGTDMQNMPPEEQRAAIDRHAMLFAEDIAEAIRWILTRPSRADVHMLRIEPTKEKLT